jgi:hypothetical protein
MHASIACLLLYEDYVWVSLGKTMKFDSKAKQSNFQVKFSHHLVFTRLGTSLLQVTMLLPVGVARRVSLASGNAVNLKENEATKLQVA